MLWHLCWYNDGTMADGGPHKLREKMCKICTKNITIWNKINCKSYNLQNAFTQQEEKTCP